MIFSIVVDPIAERAILDQINYVGVDKSARRVSILGFRHERQLPIRNL